MMHGQTKIKCQYSRVSFGLEFSLIYTGQESFILQLMYENYHD